ncbi:MAG: hypothetical protein QOJ81_575 [Chloroflexota bacterium]|jgi:hypothetical protein|nr:hypothetical protein [Chloroflexota bacterium]
MISRLTKLGVVLAVFGLAFVAAGGYAYLKVQDGQKSLTAFSAAQSVKLSYDEQGVLGGANPEEAQGIMSLLTNDWGYAVDKSELNPADPAVNTASEYMYQMATISYHVLHGTQNITLTDDYTAADGTFYAAGTPIPFNVDGRYYSQFDRTDPVQAAARGLAWSPTALALIGELGVGAATASSLQLGLGVAGALGGIGLIFLVAGLGLAWAVRPETLKTKAPATKLVPAFQA